MSTNQNHDLDIINEKFKFMGFLDHARWCDSNNDKNNSDILNYYSINMADKSASGEEILLTHFLGYITNRQTPFERIFEQLDYIFSQLVHDFKFTKRSVNELLSPNENKKVSYFTQMEDKTGYAFVSHKQPFEKSSKKEITKRLQGEKGIFYATSRFYPTDYIAIRLTLDILSDEKYNRSFFVFIKKVIGDDWEHGLERLLYALWILGYKDVGQWKEDEICSLKKEKNDYKSILDRKRKDINDLEENGLESEAYLKVFNRGSKANNRYKAKRVTCYVRDLLMYRPCTEAFKEEIEKSGRGLFDKLKDQMPDVFELPGDTWNNNDIFNKCLSLGNGNTKDAPNILVRKTYEELCNELGGKENVGCFPEQFDCTFDFVPRMCDSVAQKNCYLCPINHDNMEKHQNHFVINEELCHREEKKYCPFLLFAVGYKVECGKMKNCCPNWLKEM